MKRKAPDDDAFVGLVQLFGLEENRRVLLLGEGNLSFASAISKLDSQFTLIASTYETEEQHRERFQGSQLRTEELRKAGVQVLFGVDATDLATLPEELRARPFDRIIFQFPQHKERNKIHLNRELLMTFLREAKVLLADAGEVVVSLVQGQGGTPAEVGGQTRRPKDTWQAQEMGLEAGLLLTRVAACPLTELEELGYESTGFRGQSLRGAQKEVYQERSFNSKGSLTHCFAAPGDGVVAAFPTERKHDISFWISEHFTEELLFRCFDEVAGGRNGGPWKGLRPELTLLDEYCSPKDGRRARTYRLSVTSSSRCITEELWKTLCSDHRKRLMEDPTVEPRRSQPQPSKQKGF